jgi:Ca-activated chloride channel family protein
VRSYRLLGYENRDVADRDFRNDAVDAGEIGAGHTVTALYEVKLHEGAKGRAASVHIRYKAPDSDMVTEESNDVDASVFAGTFNEATENFRLAAVVAEFAEILRESYWARESSLGEVLAEAKKVAPEFDNRKDVVELLELIEKAYELKPAPVKADPRKVAEQEDD